MSSNLSIEGKVVDMDDNILPGVVISVDGETIENIISTVTGSNGHYELRDLPPPGGYLLSASKEGFLDWKKPVVVSPGETFTANFTMYPE